MLTIKKTSILLSIFALVLVALPFTTTLAETDVVVTVSLPAIWRDVLTDDVLAQFESQFPGVKVNLEYTPGQFFGAGNSLDSRLSSAEELVSAGDVVFVTSSSLSVEATQAGYFLDLSPLVNSDSSLNSGDFIPSVWQSYQWNGGIWALPLSTDVILVTYDAAAFDAAGVAYPTERWTIDDFASAARRLTQYGADGAVSVPGMTTVSGGNMTSYLLRSLLSGGLYDMTTIPNTPQFSDPNLEYILQTWNDLLQEGVVMTNNNRIDVDTDSIPLRIEGRNGYSQGFNNNQNNATVRYASLLPGGTAGLNVQGFAVSAGTLYPEQAYNLAKFLTEISDMANNNLSVIPARYSLYDGQVGSNPNQQGGPGGGPGGGGFGGGQIPEVIQPVVEQGAAAALPASELRYTEYLNNAISDMYTNGVDAQTALQTVEAQAVTDMQTAVADHDTVVIAVATPIPEPVLAPGEISLKFGLNSGFGGRGGGLIPNEDEWRQVIADFSASSPVVGNVELSSTQDSDLPTLTEQYDCFILPTNAVPGSDLSTVLNLDPLMDTDFTFDRNDVLGNTLAQLQQDNRTWAMPIAIEPQMLSYNPDLFALAGAVPPENGWTTDSFIDALQRLKPLSEEVAPFVPNDPSGSYIMLLIGAFGGIPIDYRTDPPTLNFTDANTVAAIQQVLDLAKNGYIEYSELSQFGGGGGGFGGNTQIAITSSALDRFRGFGGRGGFNNNNNNQMLLTFYPTGRQWNVMAYEITTGYISATAENPEACYNWLSTVARNPQLFNGMSVRSSLLNDPALQAEQGEDIVSVYHQLETLLQSPNTIVLPVATLGGGNAANFVTELWLKRAFDRYVLEDADLTTELSEAQSYTAAFLDCVAAMPEDNSSQQGQAVFQQLQQCINTVDSTVALFN